MNWQEMTGPERNVTLAQLLGWRRQGADWLASDGSIILGGTPAFTTSLDAMRTVEDEIERRGLVVPYSEALKAVVASAHPLQPDQHYMVAAWRLIHATASQRAEVAYLTLKEHIHDDNRAAT